MKILVTVKRVEDPEIKIKIKPDGSGIETDQMKYIVNPFDEIALEEALRVRDAAGGEVVVACVGNKDAQHQIRTALAMGADRAVHVLTDDAIDTVVVSTALQKVVEEEKPDLVILGKQAVDDDQGQVGAMLAERLGWGLASFASKKENLESDAEKQKKPGIKVSDGSIEVVREIDGGLETVSVSLPAVVTTELRLNTPRYASLPGIMKAKKKEIRELQLSEVVSGASPRIKIVKLEAPPQRKSGITVEDVPSLVDKLRHEAKVL